MKSEILYDVAVIGGGIAGIATAMRLQAKGVNTIIFEAHGQPGGCAGFYRKKGFSFDVGATTLVDFDEHGVGGEFFKSVGLSMPESDLLDYMLWLPDNKVIMYHDKDKWHRERLQKFGNDIRYRNFWKHIDRVADVFWSASRKGIKLPLQTFRDCVNAISAIGLPNLHMTRYLNWTMSDALMRYGLQDDIALKSALSMLIEDTVHSSLEKAPLINAALGITIRGAGLRRAKGGMRGMFCHLVNHYKQQGGKLKVGHKVQSVTYYKDTFQVNTTKGIYYSRKIVSAVPAEITQKLMPENIHQKLKKYTERDHEFLGGAGVVFLGVPEQEIVNQEITHHQILYDYSIPLGNGNNMFISVSSPHDLESAPEGYRAVMLSTHCHLDEWKDLTDECYEDKKKTFGDHLVNLARRVYPDLGKNAVIYEIGTPRTYASYTGRPNGAVGGVRQTFSNSNLNAMPHSIGVKNFKLVGDSTWPGLGTVACMLGSRIVAEQLMREN
ncbi:MAG: FAD-dependent oxidoreductase [Pyrinomonadaceae bacterium]|nr:FAD-dependent oxidoreductase [Sphingobacteriaceae bacterium]